MQSNFWNQKKVLITGHTGFKGSWLSIWLKRLGSEICGISLAAERKSLFNQLKLYEKIDNNNIFDINELKKLDLTINSFKPDIIFHLAAQPLVRESYIYPVKTWETNLLGSIKLLEAIKKTKKKCALIIITTDKVYENKEWEFGYRENDALGGHDPYSASKAALEIAVNSWRKSFCGAKDYQNPLLKIATARAGNVIGGGDWSKDRIVPVTIRALQSEQPVYIRNKNSKRPWQHVLEPLSGYLNLAELIFSREDNIYCDSFNFGPKIESNKSVELLVKEVFKYWPGELNYDVEENNFHESNILHLQIEKAHNILGWQPKWRFSKSVEKTTLWYKDNYISSKPAEVLCIENIEEFMST